MKLLKMWTPIVFEDRNVWECFPVPFRPLITPAPERRNLTLNLITQKLHENAWSILRRESFSDEIFSRNTQAYKRKSKKPWAKISEYLTPKYEFGERKQQGLGLPQVKEQPYFVGAFGNLVGWHPTIHWARLVCIRCPHMQGAIQTIQSILQ